MYLAVSVSTHPRLLNEKKTDLNKIVIFLLWCGISNI